MIKVSDMSFSYGSGPLYKDVGFIISKGQKVGLVGPNGSGKSTLLSIIRGEESEYLGKVEVLGKIGLVPQEIKYDPDMENASSIRSYLNPNHIFQDFEINKMLKSLELGLDLEKNAKKLSGGQKTKLALARALLVKPDILLLDEPTNFMDTEGKRWVMQFLANYQGTVVVISHDLDLMDKSIDKILAIASYNFSIKEYAGTYTNYLRLKDADERKIKKELEIKKRRIKRLEEGYKKMQTFDSKRSIRRRRIEREKLSLPEAPQEIKKINIKLPEITRVGEIPIKAEKISKSYGELKVLTDLNFSIVREQKIVLIGSNGTGKSTFIKILMGLLDSDSGEVNKDHKLDVGYYSQEFETFDFNMSVLEVFCEQTKKDENFARSFLGRFLISNEKIYQSVGSLSGGEKTRLSIAILTASSKNLLVLDEPTTYLDVMSQRIILEALKLYKGTLILVSHTPQFVKELKPDKAFLFPEQKMVFWDEKLLGSVEKI